MDKILVLAVVVALAGCKSEHTVDWYVGHEAERLARVEECKNDTAEMMTPDCQNAMRANAKVLTFGKPGQAIKAPNILGEGGR